MSYDQWKTASPYDDDIDPIEFAEDFVKRHKQKQWPRKSLIALLRKINGSDKVERELFEEALDIISGLCDYIEENI